MAIENENKQPSMEALFKIIRMIHLCDERELQVAIATIKALLDTE